MFSSGFNSHCLHSFHGRQLLTMNWQYIQVLLSVACILVAPKRKVAGRLEVMRSSLHFYGEFVVEGTGGRSVFNRAGGLNYPDVTSTETPEKGSHRTRSFREKSFGEAGDSEKGYAMERLDPMQHCTIQGGPFKDVKRHRRWDLSQASFFTFVVVLLADCKVSVAVCFGQ